MTEYLWLAMVGLSAIACGLAELAFRRIDWRSSWSTYGGHRLAPFLRAGLIGPPFLREHNIDISGITQPLKLFSGTAREAAKGFPANLNVAVALSLAGIGPDRTELEIWADPTVTRNTHHIEVDADSARFSMTIENVPSENPRTGRITALSVIRIDASTGRSSDTNRGRSGAPWRR